MRPQAPCYPPNERRRGELSGTGGYGRASATKSRTHVRPAPDGRRSGLDNWGAGLTNCGSQPGERSGIESEDLPRLTVKWAFAFRILPCCGRSPLFTAAECSPGAGRERLFADAEQAACIGARLCRPKCARALPVAEVEESRPSFSAISRIPCMGCTARRKAVVEAEPGCPPHSQSDLHTGVLTGRLYVGMSSWKKRSRCRPLMCAARSEAGVSAVQASDGRLCGRPYIGRRTPKEQPKQSEVRRHGPLRAWVCGPAPTLDTDQALCM